MSRFLYLCLILALSACATLPEPQITSEQKQALWSQQVAHLRPLTQWSIRGRVAVYVEDEVYNLGLNWQREGSSSQLKLEASLGQGLILLNKHENNVELITAEGDSVHGHNAQQVLYETTGLMIPVEGLESWIKGIPHEQTDYNHTIDVYGKTRSMQQDGWLINYLDYSNTSATMANHGFLPRKLYMKHDKLALKIVIDQWQNDTRQVQPEPFPFFPE